MKIVQIVITTQGGMIHYTSQLSNALSEDNEINIIAPVGLEIQLFNKSIQLNQLQTGDSIKNFIKNLIFFKPIMIFYNTIRKINPDIIHIQSCHPWMCLFLPFLQNYKIVTTVHDVNPHAGSRKFEQDLARDIHIKYSNALIVHGDDARTSLEKKAPGKRIFVIPHGDYSFFTQMMISDRKEEPGSILFFGRIADYKGLPYLIQAETKIAESVPNLKIIIAGAGTFKEQEYVLQSPHFELNNKYINDNEVSEYFQRASVIVLPYIEGTQTGIIPIAYAFKKPVVVTQVGSIHEVVENGKTGFIVPPKDPDALAEAIIKLLTDDRLRKEMGENAYRKMKDELSWNEIAAKTIHVYKTVLNSKDNIELNG